MTRAKTPPWELPHHGGLMFTAMRRREEAKLANPRVRAGRQGGKMTAALYPHKGRDAQGRFTGVARMSPPAPARRRGANTTDGRERDAREMNPGAGAPARSRSTGGAAS